MQPSKRRRRILRLNSQPEIRASGEELRFKLGMPFMDISIWIGVLERFISELQ
jgi:hypothetical protein